MQALLVEQLLDAAREPDITGNRFVRAVADGTCPLSNLQLYAAEIVPLTRSFPAVLAQIFAHCDYFPARQILLGNLLEEEGGVRFVAGQGLQLDPQQRHGELAARFASELGANILPKPRIANQWLEQKLAQGNWIGPFSYFSIGFEANIPATCGLMRRGLRAHYGLSEHALSFFSLHMEADVRHSQTSAEVLASAAQTPEARAEALDGARRGARAWWHLHERHAREMQKSALRAAA